MMEAAILGSGVRNESGNQRSTASSLRLRSLVKTLLIAPVSDDHLNCDAQLALVWQPHGPF